MSHSCRTEEWYEPALLEHQNGEPGETSSPKKTWDQTSQKSGTTLSRSPGPGQTRVFDLLTFGALIVAAMGLGTAVLCALHVPREGDAEFHALSCVAGLGLLAVLLAVLGLFGVLRWALWLIPAGAVITLAWFTTRLEFRPLLKLRRLSGAAALMLVMLGAAFLGSMAPVTESDSLAYPLPIAERLARDGLWRFWPDLARSVYPLSQEFLAAGLIEARNERVGFLSAAELVLTAALIVLLARRISSQRGTGWIAAILALGCPAVAFLAASAKEDLLLLTMTVAAVLSLNLRPSTGATAAAGLFAGLAAGAKYTGLPVCLAVVACVPFCCGRLRRASSLAVATLAAVAAGGVWYGINLARFGNPLVPFMPSVGHFPVSQEVAADWLGGFGYGREPIDALLAPFRMAFEVLLFDAGEFGGRGNWINPLIWLGVPFGLGSRQQRKAFLPLLVVSLALYSTWFVGTQVARLLLPAAVLLSIPAAEALLWGWSRCRFLRYPIGLAFALSAGIVIAVGGMRMTRYLSDPDGFLDRETVHFAAIQWMNTHLDPTLHRVATRQRSSGLLRIPWMNLGSDYQVEIGEDELRDPVRLCTALKRQGFTHLFGPPADFEGVKDSLLPVYTDPDSRLGGTHFFRSPPTESVSVFILK